MFHVAIETGSDPRSCVLCPHCGEHSYYYTTPPRVCTNCNAPRPNTHKIEQVLDYRIKHHFKGDSLVFEYIVPGEIRKCLVCQ